MAFVALGMIVFLGAVALAVDLGMLMGSRTESQRAADSGALAGAASLIGGPNDEVRAKAWAEEYAERHTVHGESVDLRPDEGSPPDVEVFLAEKKVRVRVRNVAAERDNAIPTIFARVLGQDEVNVSTLAAAHAVPSGAARCPIPLALPDDWDDVDGDNIFDPGEQYEPFDPDNQQAFHTGYDLGDIVLGDAGLIEIKTRGGPAEGPAGGGAGNSICVDFPSWRCWFQPYAIDGGPGDGGANALRPWINDCPDPGILLKAGGFGDPPEDEYTEIYAASSSGNMQSLVDDFKDLIDNPEYEAEWGTYKGRICPVLPIDPNDPTSGGCAGPTNLRVRTMPVVRPDLVTGTGSNVHAPVAALVCVWIDRVAETLGGAHGSGPPGRRNVYVRLYDGCGGEGVGNNPFAYTLQLIE
jgi:hypothetical protein